MVSVREASSRSICAPTKLKSAMDSRLPFWGLRITSSADVRRSPTSSSSRRTASNSCCSPKPSSYTMETFCCGEPGAVALRNSLGGSFVRTMRRVLLAAALTARPSDT